MDKEMIFRNLEQRYVSKREMISRVPLGVDTELLWSELVKRRKNQATILPLNDHRGAPFWYVTTRKMVAASEKIIDALYELDLENTEFDPYRSVQTICTLEESFYTSFVEGSSLSMSDAMAFIQSEEPPRDMQEQLVLNNRNAGNYAATDLYRNIDADYLTELVYILTDGLDEGGQGFRTEDWVTIPSMQGEKYDLPKAFVLPDRAKELEGYLLDSSVHPLIKTAVAQAWVLAVRPFAEGNERLGRILSTIILVRAGYTFFSEISISALIARRSYAYFEAVANTLRPENGADLTFFVEYYLDLLARAVDERRQRKITKDEKDRMLEAEMARTPLSLGEGEAGQMEFSGLTDYVGQSDFMNQESGKTSPAGQPKQEITPNEGPKPMQVKQKSGEDSRGQESRGGPEENENHMVSAESQPMEPIETQAIEPIEQQAGKRGCRWRHLPGVLEDFKGILIKMLDEKKSSFELSEISEMMMITEDDALLPLHVLENNGVIETRKIKNTKRIYEILWRKKELRNTELVIENPFQCLKKGLEEGTKMMRDVCRQLIKWCGEGKTVFELEELNEIYGSNSRQYSHAMKALLDENGIDKIRIQTTCHNARKNSLYKILFDRGDLVREGFSEMIYGKAVLLEIESMKESTSQRARRLGNTLEKCLPKGKITYQDYEEIGAEKCWSRDTALGLRMGLIEEIENDSYRIKYELKSEAELTQTQKVKLTELYKSFGFEDFSKEMLVAKMDYSKSKAGATLHEFTLLRILECTDDEKYRLTVTPETNPEYFDIAG